MPIDGPTGALLAAQKRHNWRPAHLHFLIYKPGYKTIASQIGDEYSLRFTPGESRLRRRPISGKAGGAASKHA